MKSFCRTTYRCLNFHIVSETSWWYSFYWLTLCTFFLYPCYVIMFLSNPLFPYWHLISLSSWWINYTYNSIILRRYLTILFYGLECYTLLKADIRSLDFVVTRFLMKLFKSTNTDTINDFRIYFNFLMPSELIEIRKK